MKVYLINLDRHAGRMQRMCELLQGLPFERIAAVDGSKLEGVAMRNPWLPRRFENLSKYERGCIMSHRAAWTRFLETDEHLACVLEDDLVLSPQFRSIVEDETWFPADGQIVKLETYGQRVSLSRRRMKIQDRSLAILKSLHFGTAAYVLSRGAARYYLEQTVFPDRPIDHLMFGEEMLKEGPRTYQICPAPCIQAKHLNGRILLPELASSIPDAPRVPKAKPMAVKLKTEIGRPFFQARHLFRSFLRGEQLCRVNFA